MESDDLIILGAGVLFLLWWASRANAAPAPRALIPSVTTEEYYTLPYYLDINSGLFTLPGGGLYNQNVSQGISL